MNDALPVTPPRPDMAAPIGPDPVVGMVNGGVRDQH